MRDNKHLILWSSLFLFGMGIIFTAAGLAGELNTRITLIGVTQLLLANFTFQLYRDTE